ncbi:MAG: hypothetical protein JKY48_13305 [Flavobacteriales bacterium]|nr:hypothetical protein [Flavobacteriales bacterium]
MKKLLFTLAITFGALATYAQGNDLTVRNNTSSVITIATVMVFDITTCTMTQFAIPNTTIQPFGIGTVTDLTGSTSDDWYELRLQAVPSGLGTAGSSRSYNKCLLQCSPPADYSNGLTAVWNTTLCNDVVTVF